MPIAYFGTWDQVVGCLLWLTRENNNYTWSGPGRFMRILGRKLQASSLTADPGYDRMYLERNNYGHYTIKKNSRRSRRGPAAGEEGPGRI